MNKRNIMKTAHRLTRNIVKKGSGYRTIFTKMLKQVYVMSKLLKNKSNKGVRLFKHLNINSETIKTLECVCSPIQAYDKIQCSFHNLRNTVDAHITYSIQEQW